jgi:hypothetical protein
MVNDVLPQGDDVDWGAQHRCRRRAVESAEALIPCAGSTVDERADASTPEVRLSEPYPGGRHDAASDERRKAPHSILCGEMACDIHRPPAGGQCGSVRPDCSQGLNEQSTFGGDLVGDHALTLALGRLRVATVTECTSAATRSCPQCVDRGTRHQTRVERAHRVPNPEAPSGRSGATGFMACHTPGPAGEGRQPRVVRVWQDPLGCKYQVDRYALLE